MVIIPIAALEQHSLHLPIGTDYLNGLERAKLIAQKAAVLVAPILLPGNSPYHMEFPGTITLSSQTIQQVYFEAAQSLIKHGFTRVPAAQQPRRQSDHHPLHRRSHQPGDRGHRGGARRRRGAIPDARPPAPANPTARVFDRHGGVGETSTSLYMMPNLVNLEAAKRATLTMPDHLTRCCRRWWPAIRRRRSCSWLKD